MQGWCHPESRSLICLFMHLSFSQAQDFRVFKEGTMSCLTCIQLLAEKNCTYIQVWFLSGNELFASVTVSQWLQWKHCEKPKYVPYLLIYMHSTKSKISKRVCNEKLILIPIHIPGLIGYMAFLIFPEMVYT